ncbi:hypothetical protein [Streptomyces sp. NPDC056821]|uniref:hypothetical protein n=1 Tax=unclassified Streptomyces TaxID=2593676 RepID=UPI003697DB13
MPSWRTTPFRRYLAALSIAASLALGVAGCSDGSPQQDRSLAAASKAGGSTPHQPGGQTESPLAELQGQNGLSLTITSAERYPAGYLTVRGTLKNEGTATTVVPAELGGNELNVLRTGPSLAGATVVDFAGKKRYYVLRDTDGHPLTTTGLSTLKAGESARVFMQFPAPPASTTAVGFQLPLFDTANIKIVE